MATKYKQCPDFEQLSASFKRDMLPCDSGPSSLLGRPISELGPTGPCDSEGCIPIVANRLVGDLKARAVAIEVKSACVKSWVNMRSLCQMDSPSKTPLWKCRGHCGVQYLKCSLSKSASLTVLPTCYVELGNARPLCCSRAALSTLRMSIHDYDDSAAATAMLEHANSNALFAPSCVQFPPR